MVRSACQKIGTIRTAVSLLFLLGAIGLTADLAAVHGQVGTKQTPDPEELEQLWESLARDDAGKAYQTIWKLVETPDAALSLLDKMLQPASAPDQLRIARLVEQLGDKKYAVRVKAHEALKKIGPVARPALDRALKHESEEVRKRAELVLRFLHRQGLPPEEL
jgi:HEAT repeat protein